MTERAELVDYTDAITAAIDDVFGDRLAGIWLIGSHSYGGANTSSDIDIQACVRDATPGEVAELACRIAHPELPCPAVGLEFVLYEIGELVAPSPPLQWLLNLNGGPEREHKRSTDPTSESWHWFVLDLAMGREYAVTLAGQGLADVVGPIDRHVQVEAIAESTRWHRANDDGNPNQLANAARGLRFLETDRWGSKPEGLAWTEARGIDRSEILAHLAGALQDEGVSV